MAFGTPTDGGVAYSAANGTTVAPVYPTGIQAKDVLVLIVGMKPSTANGGTIGTAGAISGWTQREAITAQGGYGTTRGADTGNTNLWIYTKDTVTGSETGAFSVTIGTNDVSWGLIVRIPGGGSTSVSYGTADAGRAVAPTSGVAFTDLLTNGTTAPNFRSGDVAIWGMCIPTDVLNNGFTAPTIVSSGTTFGTAVELEEPDSNTGSDIGGYVAYAIATADTSTAAPTVGATATGTVGNVRGPIALLRVRDTSVTLTPNRYNNTNTFYSPTVNRGARNLTPARLNNTNTFYTPEITQTGGTQTLTPARYDNTSIFYSAVLVQGPAPQTLVAARYNNTNSFYAPTVVQGGAPQTLAPNLYNNSNTLYAATIQTRYTLVPARYNNASVFYAATVSQTAPAQVLTPSLYSNTNVLYSPVITDAYVLGPARLTNINVFYNAGINSSVNVAPAIYVNNSLFYVPTVTTTAPNQFLAPNLYLNPNVIYSPTIPNDVVIEPIRYDNVNIFYAPYVQSGLLRTEFTVKLLSFTERGRF